MPSISCVHGAPQAGGAAEVEGKSNRLAGGTGRWEKWTGGTTLGARPKDVASHGGAPLFDINPLWSAREVLAEPNPASEGEPVRGTAFPLNTRDAARKAFSRV